MDHNRASIRRVAGLDSSQECQEGRGVLRYPVVGPRRELEMSHLTLLARAILRTRGTASVTGHLSWHFPDLGAFIGLHHGAHTVSHLINLKCTFVLYHSPGTCQLPFPTTSHPNSRGVTPSFSGVLQLLQGPPLSLCSQYPSPAFPSCLHPLGLLRFLAPQACSLFPCPSPTTAAPPQRQDAVCWLAQPYGDMWSSQGVIDSVMSCVTELSAPSCHRPTQLQGDVPSPMHLLLPSVMNV